MERTFILTTFGPHQYVSEDVEQIYCPAIILSRPRNCRAGSPPEPGIALLNMRIHQVAYSWSSGNTNDRILRLYYAARILEHCTTIYDDTLCACYHVTSRTVNETVKHYLECLENSGISNALELRKRILNTRVNYQLIASLTKKAKHDRTASKFTSLDDPTLSTSA